MITKAVLILLLVPYVPAGQWQRTITREQYITKDGRYCGEVSRGSDGGWEATVNGGMLDSKWLHEDQAKLRVEKRCDRMVRLWQ